MNVRAAMAEFWHPHPAGQNGFFNPAEYRSFLYLHRPAYRRHARAFGAHGERPVDDFGRVAVAAAVGRSAVFAVPATAGPLASERPSLGIRLEPQCGHLMSCRYARCPAISSPFDALDRANYTPSARVGNTDGFAGCDSPAGAIHCEEARPRWRTCDDHSPKDGEFRL